MVAMIFATKATAIIRFTKLQHQPNKMKYIFRIIFVILLSVLVFLVHLILFVWEFRIQKDELAKDIDIIKTCYKTGYL